MALPNCPPSYEFRPTWFTVGDGGEPSKCAAKKYAEHRSRAFVSGVMVRSVNQGQQTNLLAIACVETIVDHPVDPDILDPGTGLPYPPGIDPGTGLAWVRNGTLYVYNNGVEVEAYAVTLGLGSTFSLSGPYVETPAIDIYNTGPAPEGLEPFGYTALTGGDGGPADGADIQSIRTGFDRTMIIIMSREDETGQDRPLDSFNDPVIASRRIQQWNGASWISYCNTTQGACPGEGTCPQ